MENGRIGGFGLLNLLAAGLLAAAPAAAQLIVVEDGCDRLREVIVVQASGGLAAFVRPSVLRAAKDEAVAPDPPHYCMDTAATASAAFAAAMHAAGAPVSWGMAGSADYCEARSLSRCYPRLLSGELASAAELRFVHDAWRAVVDGLEAIMPYGVAGDMAVFEPNSLESSIRRRLDPNPQPVLRTISGRPQD